MVALSQIYLNWVFVIIADTSRLWQSSHLSQYISCLGSPIYPLTRRTVRKALNFSTVMVNVWLPFKQALVDSTHYFHFKSNSHLPKKNVICCYDNPLKTLKDAFYFILQALFALRIFKFLF